MAGVQGGVLADVPARDEPEGALVREAVEAEAEERPEPAGEGFVFRLEEEGLPHDPVASSLVLLGDVVPDEHRDVDDQQTTAQQRHAGLDRRVEREHGLELIFVDAKDVDQRLTCAQATEIVR